MADALGVILLTWNQAAYRYDPFDFSRLEDFLRREKTVLDTFRARSIDTFDLARDEAGILAIFNDALESLRSKKKEKRSPVAVAKALHTIAPRFFPIWDRKIAAGLRCLWNDSGEAAGKYLDLIRQTKETVASLERAYADKSARAGLPDAGNLIGALSKHAGRDKTMLKFLDEYYYAKYTGGWVT